MAICVLDGNQRKCQPLAVPAAAYVVLPVVVFLAVQLLIRLLASPSLYRDDAELLIFNQSFAWGYSEQPPLYSWLFNICSGAFGATLFSLTLFRLLLVGAIVVSLYHCGRLVLADELHARLAALSVVVLPHFAWHSLTYLTHSVLLGLMCVLTFWSLIRLTRYQRFIDFALCGVMIGLGGLSKYNYVFFLAAMIAAGLSIRELRLRWINIRLLATLLIAFVIVLPHALWLLHHVPKIHEAYSGKLSSEAGASYWGLIPNGAVELLVNMVLLLLPTAALFRILFPRLYSASMTADKNQTAAVVANWIGRFFPALLLFHLVYVFLTGTSRLHERWLEPFTILLPLYLFSRLQFVSVHSYQLRRYVLCLLLFATILVGARSAQIICGSTHRGYHSIQSSFESAAKQIEKIAAADTVIVADGIGIAGNLRHHLPHTPCVSVNHFAYQEPAGDERNKFVLVWDTEYGKYPSPNLREYMQKRTPTEPVIHYPIRYAELPPVDGSRPARELGYVVAEVRK